MPFSFIVSLGMGILITVIGGDYRVWGVFFLIIAAGLVFAYIFTIRYMRKKIKQYEAELDKQIVATRKGV